MDITFKRSESWRTQGVKKSYVGIYTQRGPKKGMQVGYIEAIEPIPYGGFATWEIYKAKAPAWEHVGTAGSLQDAKRVARDLWTDKPKCATCSKALNGYCAYCDRSMLGTGSPHPFSQSCICGDRS